MSDSFRIVTLLVVLFVSTSAYSAQPKGSAKADSCLNYDVFVLRHLEKEKGVQNDPGLSAEGEQQAKQLAELDILKNISHAFYTPYKRTYETLQYLDVEKSVYEPKQGNHLANLIKSDYCEQSVMVVGHSNTVPKLIQALGGEFSVSYAGHSLGKSSVISLSEQDYGTIFRVTFHNERRHQRLYQINAIAKQDDE